MPHTAGRAGRSRIYLTPCFCRISSKSAGLNVSRDLSAATLRGGLSLELTLAHGLTVTPDLNAEGPRGFGGVFPPVETQGYELPKSAPLPFVGHYRHRKHIDPCPLMSHRASSAARQSTSVAVEQTCPRTMPARDIRGRDQLTPRSPGAHPRRPPQERGRRSRRPPSGNRESARLLLFPLLRFLLVLLLLHGALVHVPIRRGVPALSPSRPTRATPTSEASRSVATGMWPGPRRCDRQPASRCSTPQGP